MEISKVDIFQKKKNEQCEHALRKQQADIDFIAIMSGIEMPEVGKEMTGNGEE